MSVKWGFKQDNDPKTSHIVKHSFEENIIEVMNFPAQSPGLNPIENF